MEKDTGGLKRRSFRETRERSVRIVNSRATVVANWRWRHEVRSGDIEKSGLYDFDVKIVQRNHFLHVAFVG